MQGEKYGIWNPGILWNPIGIRQNLRESEGILENLLWNPKESYGIRIPYFSPYEYVCYIE
jgi:hypothetical protein